MDLCTACEYLTIEMTNPIPNPENVWTAVCTCSNADQEIPNSVMPKFSKDGGGKRVRAPRAMIVPPDWCPLNQPE